MTQNNTPSWVSYLLPLKKFGWLLKWLLLAATIFYLYKTITAQGQNLKDVAKLLQNQLNISSLVELIAVVLLTPVNWAFESKKWQILASRVENVSFYQSLKGVLAGLALGFVMPNNVGDAAGRIISLQSQKRLAATGAALLSNGLQFYVSLLFGTVALGYFIIKQAAFQKPVSIILFCLLIFTILAGVWLIQKRADAEKYLERFGWFRYIEPYLDVIVQYPIVEIIKALQWAVARYLVFSLQFLVLLYIFDVNIELAAALACIGMVFFAKTLIPALNFLGDLGIREASAMFIFSFYQVEPAQILATTLTLWCINILLPVLIGIVWLVRTKWF